MQNVDKCTILAEEFPWGDGNGGDQFIDLVAAVKGFLILVVECKKTDKDVFTFLQPGGTDPDVVRSRCAYLTQIQDSTKRMELFCGEIEVSPKSPEATFCVVSTSQGKDQRMLERDAQRLIRGTDMYARWFKKNFKETNPEINRVFLPVIVTNAKMRIAEYDPADVSLESGQVTVTKTKLSSIEWVRFRKSFTAGDDLGHRTVMVVSSVALDKFVEKAESIKWGVAAEEGKVHLP